MTPSKKLLSEVLGYNTPHPLEIEGSKLYLYKNVGENITTLNIYELAHLCKEWVMLKNEYIIKSYKYYDGNYYSDVYYEHSKKLFSLKGNSEPEAIFKATEHIIELLEKE